MLLVLNMMDEVKKRGISIDINKLSELLGIPVIEAVAVKTKGVRTTKSIRSKIYLSSLSF